MVHVRVVYSVLCVARGVAWRVCSVSRGVWRCVLCVPWCGTVTHSVDRHILQALISVTGHTS